MLFVSKDNIFFLEIIGVQSTGVKKQQGQFKHLGNTMMVCSYRSSCIGLIEVIVDFQMEFFLLCLHQIWQGGHVL